jgi:hypothetical protein
MIVRSADITPNLVRVTTRDETWLLFRHGVLDEDVKTDLAEMLRDVNVELPEAG